MLAGVWLVWAGLGLVGVVILLGLAFWPARAARRKGHGWLLSSCSASSSSRLRPFAPIWWARESGCAKCQPVCLLLPCTYTPRPIWLDRCERLTDMTPSSSLGLRGDGHDS